MSLWKENYALGVPQLDSQHRQLILELEDLLNALKKPGADVKAQCRHAMEYTKTFTVVHFGAEEMYMQQQGYAGYPAHRELHRQFCTDLHQMELELMREDYSKKAMRKFADMLTRWWMYHIMNEDKKIVAGG